VLAYVDAEILLREAGEPDPALAKRRVQELAASRPADPLEALVELRYYQSTGAIGKDEAQAQIAKIVGDEDAVRLLGDDEAARREALEKLAPKR